MDEWICAKCQNWSNNVNKITKFRKIGAKFSAVDAVFMCDVNMVGDWFSSYSSWDDSMLRREGLWMLVEGAHGLSVSEERQQTTIGLAGLMANPKCRSLKTPCIPSTHCTIRPRSRWPSALPRPRPGRPRRAWGDIHIWGQCKGKGERLVKPKICTITEFAGQRVRKRVQIIKKYCVPLIVSI